MTNTTVRLLMSWTKPGLVTFKASGNILLVATINTTMLHVSGVPTDLIVLKLNWGLTFYYLIVTRIKLFQVYLCYYALNAAEECQDYWGLFCRFLEGRTVAGELIGTDSGDRRGCRKQHSIFKQLCALCIVKSNSRNSRKRGLVDKLFIFEI